MVEDNKQDRYSLSAFVLSASQSLCENSVSLQKNTLSDAWTERGNRGKNRGMRYS